MFVGRNLELEELKNRYASNKFEFAVIYGRRRIGKTALLRQFTTGKDTIYYTGLETTAVQNLAGLSHSIMEVSQEPSSNAVFPSLEAALESAFQMSETRRIVFVIDEYPYLAQSDKSFASTLQMLIDRYQKTSKMFLILCGSSMSYMEYQVLSYKSPLYGRRTMQMQIKPFDFFASRLFMEGINPVEQACLYGAVGGTPQYLLEISKDKSLDWNIKNMFLRPYAYLYEEPSVLLKQEMREPATYNAILSATAKGMNKLNEIASAAGITASACANYIRSLIELGWIRKETPYGDVRSKKTIYSLDDNMYRFWYRYIPPNISRIERRREEAVYEKIKADYSTYMGPIFEEICKQYLWRLADAEKLPVDVENLGRWWGPDPQTKSEQEIDIVGAEGDVYLFGECKWSEELVNTQVLRTLERRSRLIPSSRKYLYIFARNGFTDGCQQEAERMGNVSLITFQEMIENPAVQD